MKKVIAQSALIILTFSLSFVSFGQRNSDIGLSLSSDKSQRLVFEYRKPIKEKWRLTMGAAYGNYNYQSSNYPTSFSDTLVQLQSFNSEVNKGSLRLGVDRQFGNSIFSIGGDLVLHYQSAFNSQRLIEYTQDSTGISPPMFYGTFNTANNTTLYKIHSLGAGIQITGKMDVPISERFSLNMFLGPLISLNSSFRFDNITDPFDQLGFLNDAPSITTLNVDFVAGIGLKFAIGK